MTTREKLIVAATSLVVAWGGIAYFRPPVNTGPESTDSPTAADSSFVELSRQQLEASRLTEAEQYVLDTAQATWSERPPVIQKTVHTITPNRNQRTDFRYTGFVHMGTEIFAIINGHEYRRRDRIKDSAAIVDSIAAGHVVLLLENGTKRETIPFQKTGTKGE